MPIKVRDNGDGTYRVVHWIPFMFNLTTRKVIKHFSTLKEAKEYVKKLSDHSKLDIKPELLGRYTEE